MGGAGGMLKHFITSPVLLNRPQTINGKRGHKVQNHVTSRLGWKSLIIQRASGLLISAIEAAPPMTDLASDAGVPHYILLWN